MIRSKLLDTIRGGMPVLSVLAIWEVSVRCFADSETSILPPFSDVVAELCHLFYEGILLKSLLASFIRVLIGLAAGTIAGILIGTAMGRVRFVENVLRPIISLVYPIPALGWLPLLMIWVGINELLPIAVVFICAFFPICYNTANGIRNVDYRYVRVARTLGASEIRILTTVMLPLALHDIFTGLRLEAGMAWRVIVAAEMVAIPTGIGALLMQSESLVRVDTIIACIVVLSVMCFTFERSILFVEKHFTADWS